MQNRPVEYVLVTEGYHNPRLQEIIDASRKRGVSVRFAPATALARAAGTPQHQNVVAVCAERTYDDLDDLLRGDVAALLVVLDGVEDPANLGAVVRTVVGAGASGLVIPQRRAAGLSPAVARTAAGALEHAKIARVNNLVRALVDLQERGVWIYGFETTAEKTCFDLDYTGPCALVLGGEGKGLHRLVREGCDQLARIPLRGAIESLNVSVATAVVLYEAVRQRLRKSGA